MEIHGDSVKSPPETPRRLHAGPWTTYNNIVQSAIEHTPIRDRSSPKNHFVTMPVAPFRLTVHRTSSGRKKDIKRMLRNCDDVDFSDDKVVEKRWVNFLPWS